MLRPLRGFKIMDADTAARTLVREGQDLLGRGRTREALERLDRALAVLPTDVEAHLCRGLSLKAARRLEEALGAFERAIEIQPDYVPGHVNRAGILRQLGRAREALASSEQALALQPEFAPAHCNRGLALNDLDQPLEALESYDRAIGIDPAFAAAHGNRAKVLQLLDRPEEALTAYQRVTSLQPDSAQAYLNSAHTHLMLGQFARGWTLYEWRKRLADPMGSRAFPRPLWLGSPDLAGKKLLLHFEQGLGDTIQFCRYAKLARARGAAVTLVVQRKLERLIRTVGADIEVRTDETLPEEFDFHCPLMSLPLAFDTGLDSIPSGTPYLHPEPERVSQWRERIGGLGLKIGINWQGNKLSPADRGRSFPLRLFERLATIPRVRLISLQVGPGKEQLLDAPPSMHLEELGNDFDGGPDAFLDSAAVMQCLDLVITSDTAIAHLAGALARPAWVALQQVPDWRWLRRGADCPWYPTLRLFRQERRGRWDEVFESIHSELASMLAHWAQ
jgi:tetratricopeptide (TPR) repeat protein